MSTRTRPTHCGLDAAMEVISGKWKVLILWALGQRPLRYGELRRQVPGVTEKVLTAQLRELLADGVITRTSHPGPLPHVEYALTPSGTALNQALRPLGAWAREHL